MKKILRASIALAMLLVALFIPSNVYADEKPVPDLLVDVKSQSEIIAKVTVPANYDTCGFSVKLSYNTDDVTFKDVTFVSDEEVKGPIITSNHSVRNNRFNVSVVSANPIPKKESYTLIIATFSLNEGKILNKDSISFYTWGISDENGESLSSDKSDTANYKLTCQHVLTSSSVTQEPTCEEKGEKEITCSLCGEKFTEEIEALGHDLGEWTVTKQPTCKENGIETKECKKCHKVVQTREIPTVDHAFGEWKTINEATCDKAGSEQRVCEMCGETNTREIPALGHDLGEWTVKKQPTCKEKGIEESVCKTCGKTLTREIPTIDHNYGEWETVNEATCDKAGSEQRVCKVCEGIDTREIPALGHDYGEWTITKVATETEEGSKERICKICGKKEVVVIEKVKVTPPTSNPSQSGDKTTTVSKKDDKVKTGDTTNTQLYVITCVVTLAILYCLEKRRKILNK